MRRTFNYGDVDYWEERYKKAGRNGCFDWYTPYDKFKSVVEGFISPNECTNPLILGCGNSSMPMDMVKQGFKKVTCIDFSPTVVSYMQKRYADNPSIMVLQMDVRDMNSFPDETFDAIFDKAVLDSVISGLDGLNQIQKMLQEIHRILEPKGTYFLLSHGSPKSRLLYLERPGYTWKIHQTIPGENSTFQTFCVRKTL